MEIPGRLGAAGERVPKDGEFDAYVAGRGPRLLRAAAILVGPADAQDVFQDALISLYRNWHRVVAADNPDAYVHRSLVNAALQFRRRRRRIVLDPPANVGCLADGFAERDAMLQSLAGLPPRQRAVLVLAFYEDRTDLEIAVAMGCSPGTVRSQKSRGLAALRTALGTNNEKVDTP